MYLTLQLTCIALFWISVPILLVYRAKRPDVPWVFIIVAATTLGWIFFNASVFLEHAAVDESRAEDRACFNAPPPPAFKKVPSADGKGYETIVENPCPLADYLRWGYEPWFGLIYGPFYLLCCTLPYRFFALRRPTAKLRSAFLAIAAGILIVEWLVILGGKAALTWERIPDLLAWNLGELLGPYTVMPIAVALATLISWGLTTQVLQRLLRSG